MHGLVSYGFKLFSLFRAFNNDQLKSSAQDAKDAASGAADYAGEKAIEAEDAAASAAKELSEKPLV
ncbi:hypothetical protein HanHA300_Chr16g0632421 [Helianthus annuus]|nr:hypothetical protein HanHA300_Chr16g0632421 [Helianthus annuus]KAJ0462456.1 hypothetical protein HanHA89_Chr16g0683581 [Helianthus annuus]KAJ0642862.1 hypothetical protein HanLR1_Chr16g0643051 [Helianthus annuus]